MVELVVVIVLIGILGAIGAARFFDRAGFDADAFTEQSRAMLRYAQKLAIAQGRNVFVQAGAQGLALCYAQTRPCPAASQARVPSGDNSGSANTRAFCVSGGVYVARWFCEGLPRGAELTLAPTSAGLFYFNGLGRPYLPADQDGAQSTRGESTFTGLSLNIKAEGITRTVSVAPETGYVF